MPEIFISYQSQNRGKIESDKVFIKDVLKDFWFRIPDYQRSYVWGKDEISELLEDINYSQENSPNDEYFLGSMVLQKKKIIENIDGRSLEYTEYDVLDGQQRLTTLLILLAVIRDKCINQDLKDSCSKYIFQKENMFENIPERGRVNFEIRDEVQDFVKEFLNESNGTLNNVLLEQKKLVKNVSISNMANAIIILNTYFNVLSPNEIDTFAKYLLNKVLLIYVATEDLKDAFRLFTILNDRGIPLNNSDILKARNLGVINNTDEKKKYALFWEETENSIGRDEFDRILSYIRTIKVKDKARENLLKEFNEKIYGANPPLMQLGSNTMETIRDYVNIYDQLLFFNNIPGELTNEYKNLISIMKYALPSTDWVPPLLFYFNKFNSQKLINFLKKLDNKFSADWIVQLTPTFRINNMNEILKIIESAGTPDEVINHPTAFQIDINDLLTMLGKDIYERRFAKYILLKLELIYKDQTSQFNTFDHISVEHVLPQKPQDNSIWWQNFTDITHSEWLNKIGNLVLLSRIKNSSLSNKEFAEKKRRYFSGNIDSFPNSLRVMQFNDWTLPVLQNRHDELLEKIREYYNNNY